MFPFYLIPEFGFWVKTDFREHFMSLFRNIVYNYRTENYMKIPKICQYQVLISPKCVIREEWRTEKDRQYVSCSSFFTAAKNSIGSKQYCYQTRHAWYPCRFTTKHLIPRTEWSISPWIQEDHIFLKWHQENRFCYFQCLMPAGMSRWSPATRIYVQHSNQVSASSWLRT